MTDVIAIGIGKKGGGGGGGTTNYTALSNKPSINNITLMGNKSLADLGITNYDDTIIRTQLNNLINAVGNINNLAVVGVNDIVSAVNKLDLNFMQVFTYTIKIDPNTGNTKKVLEITYKNGSVVDIDLTAIITSTNIEELADFDSTTAAADKQVLTFDSASGKWIPKDDNSAATLQDAKNYTDTKFNALNTTKGEIVDSKPTYDSNTGEITYIKNGVTGTTKDTNIWFYYSTGTNTYDQTIFINGVEVTLSMTGNINLTDYVNKNTDIAHTFTGNEIDTSPIADIAALQALMAIVNNKLGLKVSTADIINDLLHTDPDKPLSAYQGNILDKKIDNIITSLTGSGSKILKKEFSNVVSGTAYNFDSPLPLNNSYIINIYNAQAGSTNITETFKDFTSTTSKDFIKNDDEINIDNNGLKIKDYHEISNTGYQASGFYEINLHGFIEINNIESVVV